MTSLNISKSTETAVDRLLWERSAEDYFRACLKVQDEHGKLPSLDPNPHQRIVLDEIARQRKKGIPVRVVVLKPRKTGTSTISEATIYREVRFRPADAVVVAHDDKTTRYLFRMARRFYENLPKEEQFPTEASNRQEILFKPRADGVPGGSITLATAGTSTAGRGFTPLYLHCSEAAFYPNAEIVMNALLNSVPDTPESMVIIESTANGMGGYFYDFWQKAKSGQSAFVPVFLSWKDFPKYSMRVPDSGMFEANLEPYERRIQSKYNLTLEQLYWRRWVINSKLKGDPELFKQEYPLDDIEAFLTSGRGRFDRELVMHWPIEDPLRGHLQEQEHYGTRQLVFIPNEEGFLRIWKKPQPGRSYIIGSDVAEGIEIAGAPSDDKYDACSAHVVDQYTGEVVAHLHGQFEPDEFGRQLARLGKWYNLAFQGIERNSNGLTVINEMEHQGYPESLIYARSVSPDGARYATPQRGWLTTTVTRPRLVNDLAQAIREQSLIVHCRETQGEFLRFVIKPSGKAEAQEGSKDDRVISLGITLEMLSAAPTAPKEKFDPEDWFPVLRPISYRPKHYANTA